MPFAWRFASGRSYARDWKTRPRSVKKSTLSCVSQTMRRRTASSSRVTMPVMPLAAAALQPVRLERQALHVAAVRERDDDLLVRDQVLFGDLLGAASR